jgi:hypothetical protein
MAEASGEDRAVVPIGVHGVIPTTRKATVTGMLRQAVCSRRQT